MALKNQCTFSICAICGTLRSVVANCNAWRLGQSKEIASRRICSWQEDRKPAGIRPIQERDCDESEVLLVCQPCLDVVVQIDEAEARLNGLFDSLWSLMKAPVREDVPGFANPASVEYEVIYEDGRKEVCGSRSGRIGESSELAKAPANAAAPPKVLFRKASETMLEKYVFLPGGESAATVTAVATEIQPVNVPLDGRDSDSGRESCNEEGPLEIVEQERDDRERDALLLLRLQDPVHSRSFSSSSQSSDKDFPEDAMMEESSFSIEDFQFRKVDYESSNSSVSGKSESGCPKSIRSSGNSSANECSNDDESADPRLRKRCQNKAAAMRYRQRQKQLMEENLKTLEALQSRNRILKRDLRKASGSVQFLKMLCNDASNVAFRGPRQVPPVKGSPPIAVAVTDPTGNRLVLKSERV